MLYKASFKLQLVKWHCVNVRPCVAAHRLKLIAKLESEGVFLEGAHLLYFTLRCLLELKFEHRNL